VLAPLKLAWRQLALQRSRLVVALAGVVFAVVLMLMQLGFRTALFESAVRFHRAFHAEVMLISPESAFLTRMKSFPQRRLYQALAADGVVSVCPVYASLGVLKDTQAGTLSVLVVGFPPEETVFDLPEVNAQIPLLKRPEAVLFDRASRPEYVPIIERASRSSAPIALELNDHRIHIAGLFTLGTSFGVDATALASDLTFLGSFPSRTPGLIEVGLVRLRPGADPRRVRDALAAALPHDVEVLTREQYVAREIRYWATVTPIGYVLGFGVLIGFVVGGIVVSQILFADVTDHLPEYATLKAIGYGDAFLYGVVASEAVVVAVLGYLPGLLLAALLYRTARAATLLPLELVPSSAALVFVLTVTMCTLAGALAMRRVQKADPAAVF